MKIASVETRQFTLEDGVSNLVFLQTDSEFTGIGETSNPNQLGTLLAAIEEVEPRILGFDPFDVNAIRTALISVSNKTCDSILPRVMNGVEAACLDIVGKQLGVPVSQLFGGSLRDEVRLCATRWEKLDDLPEDYARKAQEIAESGFTAIKFDPHVAACAPNFVMAEFPYPLRPGWNRVLKVPLELRKGFLKIPSGPGLGVECRAELENPVSLTTI